MSLDLLKEAEALAGEAVAKVESLFVRHAAAVSTQGDVTTELDALRQAFADLQAKVQAATAGLADFIPAPKTLDELKALIAKL